VILHAIRLHNVHFRIAHLRQPVQQREPVLRRWR
jgi:hypothetical protein